MSCVPKWADGVRLPYRLNEDTREWEFFQYEPELLTWRTSRCNLSGAIPREDDCNVIVSYADTWCMEVQS